MELKIDHSYSTDSRDKYQSRDHSYFRFGRKGTVHPRAYDPDPDSGRKDHSYFKLKPLDQESPVVGRADAGPDHTYGNMKGAPDRKPLRDANMKTGPTVWEETCSSHKPAADDQAPVDIELVDPDKLEQERKNQIVKDHTYTYNDKKSSKRTEQAASTKSS